MKAVLFGSLNALCDLGELERQAFNRAFEKCGLPWQWDEQTYREMSCRLTEVYEPSSADHATGRDVDLDEVLTVKDEILFDLIEEHRFAEDPNIMAAFEHFRRKGIYRGLISQQSRLIVNSVRAGLHGIMAHDFLSVTCRGDTDRPGTRQSIYAAMAEQMRVDLSRCVAIETTHRGINTALAAGVGRVVAYRVDATQEQQGRGAVNVDESLLATLQSIRWQWNRPRMIKAAKVRATPMRLSATPLMARSA